ELEFIRTVFVRLPFRRKRYDPTACDHLRRHLISRRSSERHVRKIALVYRNDINVIHVNARSLRKVLFRTLGGTFLRKTHINSALNIIVLLFIKRVNESPPAGSSRCLTSRQLPFWSGEEEL